MNDKILQQLVIDELDFDPSIDAAAIGVVRDLPGTKLIATHDLDLVLDACGRALVLDAGALHADGPAAALLADADLMDRHGLEVPHRLR